MVQDTKIRFANAGLAVILALILVLGASTARASGPDLVTWDALVPNGQVADQTGADTPSPHTPGQSQSPLRAANAFDPLDDGLLVIEDWDELAYSVSTSVLDKNMVIDGYVLPLAWKGDRVVDFLLVPWVGACIHTPAPAPNQIIHVSYPEGLTLERQFQAVRIAGTLQHNPAKHDLFLIDGRRQIPASYAISNATLAGVPGDVWASSAKDLPIAARAQIWANSLLTESMTAIGQDESSQALLVTLLLAFVYGALHTLGPGHGKAVVISYFVGTGGSLRRGLTMGVKISVIHVLSAIVVVFLLDFAVRQTTGSAPSDYRAVRLGSYALIMAIGTVMLWQAAGTALQLKGGAKKGVAGAGNGHALPHHHEVHGHTGCSACAAAASPKGSAWIASSVGLVPCTGALLVMLFGLANDLVGPAILMVGAISVGMAVAMSAIGVAALWGRAVAERRFARNRAHTLRFEVAARLAGSVCVLAIGTLLFAITWSYQPQSQVVLNDWGARELSRSQSGG